VIEFGVIGAALGSILPALVITPIYMRHSCYHLGITIPKYLRHSILPAVLPTTIMAVAVLWMRFEWGFTDYLRILTGIFTGAVLYTGVFWFYAMTRDERTWFLSRIMRTKI